MKILLTGGSGFLGKYVIKEILQLPDIEVVYAISRKHRSHPDPRVKVLVSDLSSPSFLEKTSTTVDSIIHIAGMYDLNASYEDNYWNNIASTSNLYHYLQRTNPKATFHYISTYALLKDASSGAEEQLSNVPPREHPYIHTKAIAESLVANGSSPWLIYRLGILVGDSQKGRIEKLDGPYYILNLLHYLSRYSWGRSLKFLPVPCSLSGTIPLVPVDIAAKSIAYGIMQQKILSGRIYSVFDPNCITTDQFLADAGRAFGLKVEFKETDFYPKYLAQILQSWIKLPSDLFQYVMPAEKLKNHNFAENFPNLMPSYQDFRSVFFQGFKNFILGDSHDEKKAV